MAYINNTFGNQQSYYLNENNYGEYQFVSLDDVIDQFMLVYVGEDKLITKTKRLDVAFHAQRALAELSFDTFKSCKSQEIVVPNTLQMTLPHDYINYTKISWIDSSGIKRPLIPTNNTSNPANVPLANSDGDFAFEAIVDLTLNSTDVVMDGLYYIPYRKRVNGTSIDHTSGSPWVVTGFSHVGNTTVLALFNTALNTPFISDLTVKEKLTFHSNDGLLYPNYKDGVKVTNVSAWETGSTVFKVASTSDLNGLEVGMILEPADNLNHSTDTMVVAIDDKTIMLNKPHIVTNTATNNTLYFRNPELVEATTWTNYKSNTPSENNNYDYEDYENDVYWPNEGRRYGLDPQNAQVNGSFYIDCNRGKINFSSNISGKTVVLDYLSDSLGTNAEMKVHKFAEEAMYKSIAYAILSTSGYPMQQQLAGRFKKEKFAETRKAKLRLSNIKLEEITQILRGKSKQIKH